jgi:hypothetical protein
MCCSFNIVICYNTTFKNILNNFILPALFYADAWSLAAIFSLYCSSSLVVFYEYTFLFPNAFSYIYSCTQLEECEC